MRLAFLGLPPAERSLYFQQAALRRGLHPAIMEKDFWVCWMLGVLFGHPEFKGAVVFKGGTSLSKVFGATQRFMAALARHTQARNALDRHDLRERVVAWKSRFFARSWARYDLARPGTFRLTPPPGCVAELQVDYAAMREMYMTEPLPFAEVLDTLAELERMINGEVCS